MQHGFVQVYTGDGKGKTTAALGLTLRAVGHKMKVLIVQFIRGKQYVELEPAKRLRPFLTIKQAGRKTFVFKGNPNTRDLKLAQKGFSIAKKAIQGKEDNIVILDEINVAVNL